MLAEISSHKACDNPPHDTAYANQEKSAGNSWNEFSVKSPSRDKYSEKNTQGVTGNELSLIHI